MITYQEYVKNPRELHHAFYLEVALSAGLTLPEDILLDSKRALAGGDEHLNSVKLPRWDRLLPYRAGSVATELKKRGTFYNIAAGVCTLKALVIHLCQEDATP